MVVDFVVDSQENESQRNEQMDKFHYIEISGQPKNSISILPSADFFLEQYLSFKNLAY
jgi:hypothetical protein